MNKSCQALTMEIESVLHPTGWSAAHSDVLGLHTGMIQTNPLK
jgi:hypothetical protein